MEEEEEEEEGCDSMAKKLLAEGWYMENVKRNLALLSF